MIVDGKIVPVEITVNLIKKAMMKFGWNEKKFWLMGFQGIQKTKKDGKK